MRALVFSSLLVASLLAAACSTSSRSSGPSLADAGAKASDASVDAATKPRRDAAIEFDPDASMVGRTCERPIDVGALALSTETCFVNEHVSNRSGKLTFPCEGGEATITFAGKEFAGTVDGDDVSLELVEPFVFNNCQWESTEKISGDLATGKLAYHYQERPLAACTDSPCTANGTLTVESGAVVVVK